MPKINYKLVVVPDTWTLQDIEDNLNQVGKRGWMLQQFVNKGNAWLAVMIKKIAD